MADDFYVPDYAGGYAGNMEGTLAPNTEPVTLDDHLSNIKATLHGITAEGYADEAQHETDPAWQKYFDDMAKYHSDYQDYHRSKMSSTAQQASEHWNKNYISGALFGAEQQAPSLGLALGAGTAGTLLGGPVAGAAAGAAVWGKMSANSAVNAARDYIINQAPESELLNDPDYKAKRQFMSEADARSSHATDKINNTMLESKAFGVGAAAGLVGEAETLGLTPGVSGITKSIIKGMVGGTGAAVIQTPLTDLALGQVTPGLEKTPGEIATETGEQMLALGGFSALGGAAHEGFKPRERRAPTTKEPGTSGGRETSGTDNLRKPLEEIKPEANVPDQGADTPPGNAPSPTDDAQKQALDSELNPKPATPTPGVTPNVESIPESKDTLKEQEQGLRDGTKEAVLYPGGTDFSRDRIKNIDNIKNIKLPNGDIVAFRPDGDQQLTPAKIREAAKNNKLNEVLGYGPTSQEEAVSRAAQGETPVAVTERTPDGTEVKAAAGTTQTAPAQQEALEANKARPDNTVQVEDSAKIIAERQAAQKGEVLPPEKAQVTIPSHEEIRQDREGYIKTLQDQFGMSEDEARATVDRTVAPTIEGEKAPTPGVTGRTLKDLTQPEAEGYKPPGITETVETPPKPGKKGIEQVETRQRNNDIANSIIAAHPIDTEALTQAIQGTKGSRLKVINQFKEILAAAKAAGHEIPTRVRDSVDPARNHNVNSIILSEMQRLVNKQSKEGTPAWQRFASHLDMALKGDREGLVKTRVAEAKEHLDKPDLGKKEALEAPEQSVEEIERELAAKRAELEEAERAQALERRRQESEELKKAAAGAPQETTEKISKAPIVEIKKTRKITPRVTVTDEIKAKVAERAQKFDEEGPPTAAEREAGNYDKVHVRFAGRDVSIETGAGETRPPYGTKLPHPYGYIRGTISKDGDHVDITIGPKGDDGKIFVLNQMDHHGTFDEPKVFGGFTNMTEVIRAYKSAYDDPKVAAARIGGIVEMDRKTFDDWLDNGDKSQPVKEGLAGESPDKTFTTAGGGKEVQAPYIQRETIGDAFKRIDVKQFPAFMRPVVSQLMNHISKLVGDVPAYWVDHSTMFNISGRINARGYYLSELNHMVLNTNMLDDPKVLSNTILHEAFHAATLYGYRNSTHLQGLADRLFNEASTAIDKAFPKSHEIPLELRYPLTSPVEMLTEITSNTDLQNFLKHTKMSEELANDLGMAKWRRSTLFNGIVDWFRQVFGLEPRQYGLIEGAFNIGERAMHPRDIQEEAEYHVRGAAIPDAHFSASYSQSMTANNKTIQDRLKDLSRRDLSPAAQGLMANIRDILNTKDNWIDWARERLGGNSALSSNAELILDRMQVADGVKNQLIKDSNPIMDRLNSLFSTNRDQYNKLADLLVDSTVHGADARDDLGTDKNTHIKVNKTNPEKSAKEHHDAIKNRQFKDERNDKIAYDKLDKDTKQLYNDTVDTLTKMNKDFIAERRILFSDNLRKEMSRSGLPADLKAAIEKVIDIKDLTPLEEQKFGNDKNIKTLREYNNLIRNIDKRMYFPLQRQEGTHVVRAEYAYSLPAGATRVSNDPKSADYHRIRFNTEKEAFNFSPDLPTTQDTVHYHEDTNTGKRTYTLNGRAITKDDIPAAANIRQGEEHHVTVNNREVRFVNGFRGGERVRDIMKEEGLQNISGVEPVKNKESWQFGVNSGHVSSLIDRVNNMSHLTDNERRRMTEAIKHVAAASMPNSRLSKAFLKRDRTGGAGRDILQTMDRYRKSVASQRAIGRVRDEVDAAMDRMKTFVDNNRDHAYIATMRQMTNAFEEDINHYHDNTMADYNANKRWAMLRAYTTMRDLVSPAFYLLHQLHIPLTVYPDLAARVGFLNASRITLGVYRDLAGQELTMGLRGARAAFTKSWKYDYKPTDFVDIMRNTVKSAAEKRLLDYLVLHNNMHALGIDYSQSYASSGMFDRTASKMRNFSQEFIGSADIMNRTATALMFFRAAKERGLSDDAAFKEANDAITRTQGQQSVFNRSKLFGNKYPMVQSVLMYRQYPMILARTIAKAAYNSLHPDTDWETRARAFRTLGYMTMTATAMSGLQGGTAYPIRMLDDVLHLMGITDGWETHMDELRRSLADSFGSEGATLLMDGLGGTAGIYAGHRGGISDPLGINYYLEASHSEGDLYKWMAGAPAGTIHDAFTGTGALLHGDIMGAMKNLLPRVVVDPMKAYKEWNEGVSTGKGKIISPAVSIPQALEKALGFTTITEQHAREARAAVAREHSEQQQERQRITELVHSGNIDQAVQALREYRAKYPHDRVNLGSIIRSAAKPTLLGYPESSKNRVELEQRARAYGLQ